MIRPGERPWAAAPGSFCKKMGPDGNFFPAGPSNPPETGGTAPETR